MDTVGSAARKISQVLTLDWTDIEEWQRDNEYIVRGYRKATNSFSGCFHSTYAYLNNETGGVNADVNIHSHFWGAVLFGFFLITFQASYLAHHDSVTWGDVVVFTIFLTAAVFCLLCSAVYHTVTCHSREIADLFHFLDYAGIVVLIVGSFVPCVYYAFYCDPHYRKLYIVLITIAGSGAAYTVLSPTYATPAYRETRTAVFIALGLCAVFPVTHASFAHGLGVLTRDLGFGWLILSGGLYIIGALIYANRLPERFYPGRFDYFFASHQIFHCCVVAAAIAHYICVVIAFRHRHGVDQGVCI